MTTSSPEPLHLRFGRVSIEITAQEERLVRKLASYFEDFVAPSPPRGNQSLLTLSESEPPAAGVPLTVWDGKAKESFGDADGWRVVRKDRTGVVIHIHGREWAMSGPLTKNFSQVVNVVGAMYGLRVLNGGGAMIHASYVVRNGRGVAVMGQSGMGKSSVAVRLLEEGFDFVSNDRLILERNGHDVTGYGLPKLPRVNPGTLLGGERTSALLDAAARDRYGSMPSEELWQVEDKYDLDVEGALGRHWLLQAPVACIFDLEWRYGQHGFSVMRLRPEQALTVLRGVYKDFGCLDQLLTRRTDTAIRETAERVPVFRIAGGADPGGLARAIARGEVEEISGLL